MKNFKKEVWLGDILEKLECMESYNLKTNKNEYRIYKVGEFIFDLLNDELFYDNVIMFFSKDLSNNDRQIYEASIKSGSQFKCYLFEKMECVL